MCELVNTMANSLSPISRDEFMILSEKADTQHHRLVAKIDELVMITHVGLKALYLVPVTLGFILMTGTFLWYDKISVWIWLMMNLILMTPFFGEGLKMLLPFFGKEGGKLDVK